MAIETRRIDDASIPLVTDLNGVTIPVMQGGVSKRLMAEQLKYDNLIAEYVHTANKEVVIQSYDSTTGYFTAPNHGLINGRQGNFLLNWGVIDDPSKVMFPVSPAWGYGVTVIDENTFYLGEILQVPTNLDLTKFHFEQFANTYSINFTGLNIKEMKVVMFTKGFRLIDFLTSAHSVNDLNLSSSPVINATINSVNSQGNRIFPSNTYVENITTFKIHNNTVFVNSSIKTVNIGTTTKIGSCDIIIIKPTTSTVITKFTSLNFLPNGALIRLYKI